MVCVYVRYDQCVLSILDLPNMVFTIWVRGYRVCPDLMLTLCPGILYSLIAPTRGLVGCKQSEEQAATWLIIARWTVVH